MKIYSFFATGVSVIIGINFNPNVAYSFGVSESTSGINGVTNFGVPGWDTEIGLVGEGRIGDRGGNATHELTIGKNTDISSDFDQANFDWTKATSYGFTFNYDGSEAIFNLNGTEVTWDNFSLNKTLNGLALRTSTFDGQKISFTNLKLDSNDVGGGNFDNDNISDTGSERIVKYLLLNDTNLASGFELTGDVAFDWNTNQNLSQSRLAFQIKGANVEPTAIPPVPEPATILASLTALSFSTLLAFFNRPVS